MKEIQLTQGKVALVDDDVYEWASKFKWFALRRRRGLFYAARQTPRDLITGKQRTLLLHREVLQLSEGVKADHRDGDGLRNLRNNLRIATTQENSRALQKKRLGKSSRFRGVSWRIDRARWQARIYKDGNCNHLGMFSREEDAARAYDKAALQNFGEFYNLNLTGPVNGV